MKVLHIASTITDSLEKQLNKNSSGYGLMVKDIVNSINQVSIVKSDAFILKKPFLKSNNKIYRHLRKIDILYSFKHSKWPNLFYLLRRYGKNAKNLRDIVYYFFISYSLGRIISEDKYDIVHIHGCGFWLTYLIDLCDRLGIKYVVTLHGLNSFGGINLNNQEKLYERDFLKIAFEKKINTTVVSSGCLKCIEDFVGKGENNDQHKFKVIYNGAKVLSETPDYNINIREEYDIPKDKKVLLYVGNINKSKNQVGFIDGFSKFLSLYNIDAYVLFLGRNDIGDEFLQKIKNSSLNDKVRVCGNIPKDNLYEYFKQSDGVVLISKSEGFGLSLVESMMVGKPCMMVEDMAAFDDIYEKNCCVKIISRNENEVAEGIKELLCRKWDERYIHEYSKKFNLQSMAKKYIELYKTIISE